MSIGLSIVGIMLYVAFRFEIGYGIGAVVSTVHDVLMTIGIFVLTGREFTAPMVGAILLIVGYSINDTIVVFDRIREELKLNPNTSLREIINMATSRVFARSILTSLTTFLAALALFLFGGGIINDLSFTFLVGIVTGTFSSIFIASPIFYWWHKGDRKHVEAHHDIAPKYEWTGSSKASH
jgi:SecD/SecF fusion protein